MKLLLILFILFLSQSTFATVYQVGSTKEFLSPNALYLANVVQNGDTIEIDPETYIGTDALANWQKNDLVIRGINGLAKMNAAGEYILGKGIWVLSGNNIKVEYIEFFGAKVPDKNGAGIRLDGEGMNVQHCFFHDNENGILTSNPGIGDIVIEHSEFANNGYGDGFTHNLYIGHVSRLTFRFNYSHHTNVGHNLKSRAKENIILYNRIMDEETGNSSRLIDISNGGFTIIMGNILMQGENAPNNNMIGYGLEGLFDAAFNELYIINNTFVNKRTASCLFLDINNGVEASKIANNIFAGNGIVYNGNVAELNNNLIETDLAKVGLRQESNYDYSLELNSPAIDVGEEQSPINGISLTPNKIYDHPQNSALRINNGNIDLGAYEYVEPVNIGNFEEFNVIIYPNPVIDVLNIQTNIYDISTLTIMDEVGKVVYESKLVSKLKIDDFTPGIYFLRIELKSGRSTIKKFIKN